MNCAVVKSDVERGFGVTHTVRDLPISSYRFRSMFRGWRLLWMSNGHHGYCIIGLCCTIPSPPTDINLQITMSSSNPYDNDAHSINEDDLIDPDDGMLFVEQSRTTLTGCQISMT